MISDDVERAARELFRSEEGHEDVGADAVCWRDYLDDARVTLLAYHRSRTYTPEEVEAVAKAMWNEGHDEGWDSPFAEQSTKRIYLNDARAALAASDAWRAQQIERMTTP